jgi:hypothetical protein
MGKYMNPNTIDLALADIKANANMQVVCSAQPASYADAFTNYKLGSVAMTSADYTLANGDVSGRKITVAAKAGVPVSINGTVTHVALIDTVNSVLKHVTTTASTAVAAGGTVDVGSYKDEIQAPA